MTWKAWVLTLANAFGSGAISGAMASGLGVGTQKALLIALSSGLFSAGKWYLQHPPPGVPKE